MKKTFNYKASSPENEKRFLVIAKNMGSNPVKMTTIRHQQTSKIRYIFPIFSKYPFKISYKFLK